MERETREITTPGGHKVVLRTYLTGGESRAIRALIFADIHYEMPDVEGGKPSMKDVPADFIVKQEQKKIELLVVSVDGDTNAPAAKLDDLLEVDYNAVLEEIDKISVPFTPAK